MPSRRVAHSLLSVGGPPAVFGVLGWQRRWVAEDGFITLRVVRQLEAGHGPVFNVGERVEASTSALWTVLLAVVHAVVRIRLEVLAVGLGLALSVAGLAFAGAAARRLWAPGSRVVLPLGTLVVLAVPPFWDFATSGLETGLSFAWLGASGYLVARAATAPWDGRPAWLGAAVVVGLGPLVRPDLALVAGPLLLALAALRAGRDPAARRSAAAVIGAGLALPVAYQVFRMGYYGALVPNPGLTKEASEAWWSQGRRYLADTVWRYALWLPAIAVAALLVEGVVRGRRSGHGDERWRVIVAGVAPIVGGALHALYVTRVGGDFMHGRLLLPGLFAACLPVMVVAPRRPAQWGPVAVMAAWAVAVGLIVRPALPPGIPASGIADERATWVALTGRSHPVLVEDYGATAFWRDGREARQRRAGGGSGLGVPFEGRAGLTFFPQRDAPAGEVGVVAGNIGVVGAAAGTRVRVVDVHGLGDRIGAHLVRHRDFRIGHQKRLDPAWVWARYVASGPAGTAEAVDTPVPPEGEVDAARAALGCGELRRLVVATTASLTAGRFLHNLTEAVRLHGFRFDGDPDAARAELCPAESGHRPQIPMR